LADAYTTFAAMINDAPNVYIATRMIELLNRILVVQKVAMAYPLENKNSKTLRVVRVNRLSLPNAQLVEGVTPATVALTLTNVDVTVEQWGIVVVLTDVVELTVRHPMLNIAIERVAMAMKETAEREDATVLMAATNVTYPGSVTARSGLASTDVFNTALAVTIKAKLSMRGAPKYSGGTYMALIQPPHTAALTGSDTVFQAASNYAKEVRLEYGYIGMWQGLDCVEGNFLPVFVGVDAATTAAITTTKAKYTVGTSGTLSTANYQIKVVGREVTTDYERRLSVQTGNIAVTSPGSIAVQFPSSTNYVYDLYMTAAAGTTAYLIASRQAASSTYTITTDPAGTEATAPVSPALGVSVYPGFVCGMGGFGTCTLNGMALQTFVTPKGPSDSDPLSQRRKIGAKYMRKSFILDNDFIERFETSSPIAATIPA
jgi:N4-gp56 family major capsid protein